MTPPKAGGGWPAIFYTLRKARASGGFLRMWRALRSKNACKTCALGMGGQLGGMVNERGKFPEVCKKSVQAMAADMQGRIREGFFDETRGFGFDKLARFTPRELEHSGRLVEPLIAEPGDKGYRPISWDEAIERVADALIRARSTDNAEITARSTEAPEKANPVSPSASSANPQGPQRCSPPVFFYFSGRSSNEAAFLLNLLGRVYGTNNINNCSYFCHQASGVALKGITGSGTASIVLDDLAGEDGCDLLFIIGGNPASNHPRLMRTVVDIRRRGGKVVVVNPLKELGLVRFKVPSDVRSMLSPDGSRIADEYVQPHIGGDLALFAGIAKALLEQRPVRGGSGETAEGAEERQGPGSDQGHLSASSPPSSGSSACPSSPSPIDEAYLKDHTENFDEFRAGIDALAWADIERSSGIARAEIEKIAGLYAKSGKTVFAWTMGITHHTHGVDNVRMIAACAMLRGMLGRPGAGLLPLRGHSNVQGIGSMGVEPRLKWEVLTAMQQRFGVALPTAPGLDTLACIDAAARGEIRFAWHLGGNLFGSCPDAARAARALRSIDLTVFLSTTLNTGHIHGRGKASIILPVLARDEEPQSTTQESMFNYVRLSDGGRARYTGPHGPPLSEVEVMTRVFRKVLGDRVGGLNLASMTQHSAIRDAIAATIPGYAPIANMDRRGQTPPKARGEFQIPDRTFHTPRFKTESGRARFFPVPPLPLSPLPSPSSLRLMTIRSEGQFNTVVYEDHDLYRGTDRRDIILMHPDDLAARGLKADDRVTIRSPAGEMTGIRIRPADIRPGNAAMYYPEANVLVPAATDPESRTPAFKNAPIEVWAGRSLPILNP